VSACALIGELSFLSMLMSALTFTIPVGRFVGLAWLIAVGFLLPRNRASAAIMLQPARGEAYWSGSAPCDEPDQPHDDGNDGQHDADPQ
jgi:hypothetical protein